jgi:peptide/nickel transport system substrate-binding protein
MVLRHVRPIRGLVVAVVISLTLSACTQEVTPTPSPTASPSPATGGTIYLLSQNVAWNHIDPQRIFTDEDLAFFGATLYRSLETFQVSPDRLAGTTLTPDLATDLGTHNADATQWSFTLRDGVTWQDGSPVTCEDVKYGVSRTFATDIINEGPIYAISYLDIPAEDDPRSSYLSKYHGPYDKTGQALFDKAVTCEGSTITFRLKEPVADFNYAVSLGMFPVRRTDDTRGAYDDDGGHFPMSDGPYKIQRYSTGRGGKMILVRNPAWNSDSDPVRQAFPDRWEIDFGLDGKLIDRRLMASAGADATALAYGSIGAPSLPTIFADPSHPAAQFARRAVNDFAQYVQYLWVDVTRIPDVNVRRAMWVALDRQALRDVGGASGVSGAYWGDYADGVLAPDVGQDYAPTGLADGSIDWLRSQQVPARGDPTLAREILGHASEKARILSYGYVDTPTETRMAMVIKSSLEKAGFTIKLEPSCVGCYYSAASNRLHTDFGNSGWGPDWPNASTVFGALFTPRGGWDLSQLDDPAFSESIAQARSETDRATQARMWQALNRQVVENMYVLPTFFTRAQTLAGNRVGPIYRWPAYYSWPYPQMYVRQP